MIRRLLSGLWWVAVERGWWRLASWLPIPITEDVPARELV